ncbi:MAG TPA: dipeptide epimerase [Flavobacterium sp.]|jgi:L-alanine-DL-glutamate epimerase-like enolase superfamily enzyme
MALTLTYKTYELPLRHPFTISRYTVTAQKTIVACISDGEISGYGEATANPYYNSTVEKLAASVDKVSVFCASAEEMHPRDFWNLIEPCLQNDYFALCAIDIAFWDYYARKHGRTLRSFFSSSERTPITSYTIGIDTIGAMAAKILETPWPLYKIKLGTNKDIEIVESLRKVTDAMFRVDANAAWSAEQAIFYSKELKQLNVEFIEQPLPAIDIEAMRKVKFESELPLIADESCQRSDDVKACSGLFHGINIKLMKCGGITPALNMIETARKLNLSVMAGCMTESTVGISALAQIAPLLDYLDADGAMLLASDIASGVSFSQGEIQYADRYGTGAEILAF